MRKRKNLSRKVAIMRLGSCGPLYAGGAIPPDLQPLSKEAKHIANFVEQFYRTHGAVMRQLSKE